MRIGRLVGLVVAGVLVLVVEPRCLAASVTRVEIENLRTRNLDECGPTLSAAESAALKWLVTFALNPDTAEWKVTMDDRELNPVLESALSAELVNRAVKTCQPAAATKDRRVATRAGLTSSATTSTVGFDESAILWGLTEFLVRRADKELEAWFFGRLQEEICGEESRYRDWFPHGCPVLRGAQLSNLIGGPSTLRSAFRRDLEGLLRVVPRQIEADLCSGADTSSADKKRCDALLAASYLGGVLESMLQGEPPLVAIVAEGDRDLSTSALTRVSRANTPIADSLFKLSFLLQAIMVERKASGPEGGGSDAGQTGVKLILSYPKTVAERNNTLASMVVNLAEFVRKSGGKGKIEGVAKGFAGDLDSFDGTLGVVNRLFRIEETGASLVDAVEQLGRELDELKRLRAQPGAGEAQLAVAYARIGDATSRVLTSFLDALPDSDRPKGNEQWVVAVQLPRLGAGLASRNYADVLVNLVALMEKTGTLDKAPAGFVKTLSFAVEVAQAKDAESVAGAIEVFAAPVGSYSRKREEHRWHWGVNAYVGGFLASEQVFNVDDPGLAGKKLACSFGAWVPVGFEFGKGSVRESGRSVSGLVQVLDVGALASYRVKRGSVESAPNVNFEQVFSPGIFAMVGLRNKPLSIGLGASYSPALRSISDAESGVTKKLDTWRIGVVLGLDLPLFLF